MKLMIQSILFKTNLITKVDAETVLADILKVNRAYLHAHPEQSISQAEYDRFETIVQHLAAGEPMAYLLGRQAFWTLSLKVTPATLIPRSETELLVEQVLALFEAREDKVTIADLGTGSGAVALALASELPNAVIHAVDISAEALDVAKENAQVLGIQHVVFHRGAWFDALPKILFDFIVTNPPYVALNDPHLEENVQKYEPALALFSGEDGLDAIRHIIFEAFSRLKPGGYLLLEHGFQQGEKVRELFSAMSYVNIATVKDLSGLDRVTLGSLP